MAEKGKEPKVFCFAGVFFCSIYILSRMCAGFDFGRDSPTDRSIDSYGTSEEPVGNTRTGLGITNPKLIGQNGTVIVFRQFCR